MPPTRSQRRPEVRKDVARELVRLLREPLHEAEGALRHGDEGQKVLAAQRQARPLARPVLVGCFRCRLSPIFWLRGVLLPSAS